jgi:hypothetical protein
MSDVKPDWFRYHNQLLGQLAAAQESLSAIHAGAPLQEIEESLEDLQTDILDADERPPADDPEDEEEDPPEEDDEED